MKKYLIKAVWYRKASGSCRSYKGKKATPIEWEMETLEKAKEWAKELEKGIDPYKHYERIEIVELY